MTRLLRWALFLPMLVAAGTGAWLSRQLSPPAASGEPVVFVWPFLFRSAK